MLLGLWGLIRLMLVGYGLAGVLFFLFGLGLADLEIWGSGRLFVEVGH